MLHRRWQGTECQCTICGVHNSIVQCSLPVRCSKMDLMHLLCIFAHPVFCIVNVKNSCAGIVAVCTGEGCWRGACTLWLSFLSQNLPKGALGCPHICLTVFVTLSFSVLYFFIIFFFREPLVPPRTDVPVLVVCLRDLSLHERHSLYMQALAWVSQHNSSATLLKLNELIMPRWLSLLSCAPLVLIPFGILVSYSVFLPWTISDRNQHDLQYMFTI